MNYKRHGMKNEYLYGVWKRIKNSCHNPNAETYHNYGALGIEVDEQWKHDFEEFYLWAMDAGYKKGMAIDRIDKDGDFAPWNCRWIELHDKYLGRHTDTIQIEVDGVSKSFREWSESTNIPEQTLRARYKRGAKGAELIRPTQRRSK